MMYGSSDTSCDHAYRHHHALSQSVQKSYICVPQHILSEFFEGGRPVSCVGGGGGGGDECRGTRHIACILQAVKRRVGKIGSRFSLSISRLGCSPWFSCSSAFHMV